VPVPPVRGAADELRHGRVLERDLGQQRGRAPERHRGGDVEVALARGVKEDGDAIEPVDQAARRGGELGLLEVAGLGGQQGVEEGLVDAAELLVERPVCGWSGCGWVGGGRGGVDLFVGRWDTVSS